MAGFNAADTKHLRAAKRTADADSKRDERVIHWLMQNPEARAYIHDLLVRASVFHTPFAGVAAATDFNCGRQSIGLELLAEIVRWAPDQYIQMMREQSDKESANGRRYGSNGNDNDGYVRDRADGGGGDSGTVASDYDPAADLNDGTDDAATADN